MIKKTPSENDLLAWKSSRTSIARYEVRKFGMDMYTLLYLKWITNEDLWHSTGNSAQCYVATQTGGEPGGELIYAHVSLEFHFHFSLSFIGEGNGSPLQCSCLENPRDGGARWAAVYGVV